MPLVSSLSLLALAALQAPSPSPSPAGRADTAAADTLRRTRLPDVEVAVARSPAQLSRLPAAAGVVERDAIRRDQPAIGLDEFLTLVPGVLVANRYNYSLDQRLSIRGFGSRANFGVRGVKIFLDGVPQTLPDGQSQLSNVDFAALERAEVLRGASSALYGNASGGAVLLFSDEGPPAPWAMGLRVEGGSFGTSKWTARGSARSARASGVVTVSRLSTDGFRAHSSADIRQASGLLALALDPSTRLRLRLALSDSPRAENPGALTRAEADTSPSAASPNNVRRGADKEVTQQQLSASLQHTGSRGWTANATAFLLWRDLENPLATPPPGPFSPTAGTFNTIDRVAGGGRFEVTMPGRLLGSRYAAVQLTAGLDLQRMRDNRENRRSVSGEPTDSVLADQREVVSEVGPFLQVRWDPAPRVAVQAGVRYDRIRFDITDRHLSDGENSSGARTMAEASANLGASVALLDRLTAYGSVATAFETPTSTELVATAGGGIGLNRTLGPQRATSLELGLRSRGGAVRFSVAAFRNRVRDAIVQAREADGRAFFTNAARLSTDGLEVGLNGRAGTGASLSVAYTYSHFRFGRYRVPDGDTVQVLDGRRLPGVPRHFLRATLETRPWRELRLTVDQTMSSSLFADDVNATRIDDWGPGVTNLRGSWQGGFGRTRVTPFVALFNFFDRSYVGSVTVNGAASRVFEPSPGRNVILGMEVDWIPAPGH